MVLVILQHSYLSVSLKSIHILFDFFIWPITGLAAVAFVSISGMVYSYFLYMASDWRNVYRRYAKRAAFLLLAAHPAINLASYYFNAAGKEFSSCSHALLTLIVFNFPITDMIAICLLIAPVFIVYSGSAMRAVVIIAMLVSAVFVRVCVTMVDPLWAAIQEVTFGVLGVPSVFWFPLVPWLAIFLTGSFAGQGLAYLKKGSIDEATLVQRISKAGIALGVCGGVLTVGYKMLKITFGNDWSPNVFLAIYPGQTTTLLPAYLAVLAFLLASLVKHIDLSGKYNRLFWLLSVFGRTSLFTFVIQFAIVESVPALLGLKGGLSLTGFVILFLAGMVIVWIFSYWYGRVRGWIQKNDYAVCVKAAQAQNQSIQAIALAR